MLTATVGCGRAIRGRAIREGTLTIAGEFGEVGEELVGEAIFDEDQATEFGWFGDIIGIDIDIWTGVSEDDGVLLSARFFLSFSDCEG